MKSPRTLCRCVLVVQNKCRAENADAENWLKGERETESERERKRYSLSPYNLLTIDIDQPLFLSFVNPRTFNTTVPLHHNIMTQRDTIAIIGALTETGKTLVKGLMKFPFRLLLMDESEERLFRFQHELAPLKKLADINTHQCSRDACWEADVIMIIGNYEVESVSSKIRDVATGKVILLFETSASNKLEHYQQLLPHSMVVQVVLPEHFCQPEQDEQTIVFIEGEHQEAIETSVTLIKAIGLQPQIKMKMQEEIN